MLIYLNILVLKSNNLIKLAVVFLKIPKIVLRKIIKVFQENI